MKQLTVMQELIEELESILDVSCNPFISQTLILTIDMCKEKVNKEKAQIFDAHYVGSENPYSASIGAGKYIDEMFKKESYEIE